MLQDLRFAVRLLVKERWFSAVAIVALALGIGLNATVFTLVNAVLIRGLPFKDSQDLYMLVVAAEARRPQQRLVCRLQGVARADQGVQRAWRLDRRQHDHQRRPAACRNRPAARYLTANAFSVVGQRPLLGRDFGPRTNSAAPIAR